MRIALLIVLLGLAAACGVDDAREREVARVHAHLARVAAALAARPVDDLAPARRAARAEVLANLRAYIAADTYPTNEVSAEPTPIFIDPTGVRCAMAYLIEASGEDGRALVARVAAADDYAHLADLAGDAELARWLDAHGLTLAEAAAIQPSYANVSRARWVPTVSAIVSAQVGAAVGGGDASAEAWLAGGIRAGVRRVEESYGACDRCVFRADAIVAEYARADVPGTGATNELGLLVQHELGTQGEDHQIYVIGGPIASLDERSPPGSGIGAEAGFGWSLQRRTVPLFAEVVVSEITHAHGAQVHAGVTAGVVW